MSNNRDEFLKKTKDKLAQRVAFRCSNPDCRVSTIATSYESSESVSNIGVAAHICAAAGGQGARRYNTMMTSGQRKSIENGIWLCQSCSTLIDKDEITYSVDLLKQWKTQAEDTAKAELGQKIASQKEIEPLAPFERLKIYLRNSNDWKHQLGEGQNSIFHYKLFPEFTIVENHNFDEDEDEYKYNEPWVSLFPDPRFASRLEYFAKYHDTVLTKIYLVYCDSGRFLTAEPKRWIHDSPQTYYYAYYLIKDSIECLVEQMINEVERHNNCRALSIYEELVIFESEEDANQRIEADFINGKYQYIYYEFNKNVQQYSRIKKGVLTPIIWG